MRKIVIFSFLLISACSTTELFQPAIYEKTYDAAELQWKENVESDRYREYFDVWSSYNNENKIDEKDGCYSYGKGVVKFILVLDKNGVVEKVVPQGDDQKTKCFVKAYTGVKFPKPPIAPFYNRMTMN